MQRSRVLVPLYFVLVTVAFTWPAARNLSSSVVGDLGDNLHFAWLMGWFDQALLQDLRWPFFAPQLNYPEGWDLARSETTPLLAVLGIPFTRIGGPLFAYNVVALATFVLTGWMEYAWVKKLTQNRLAALLAGTLFAFIPFRFAHYRVGHLNILGMMWFPPFFYALFSVLKRGGTSRRVTILGGLSLGLIALTSQYYLYVTLVAAAFTSLIYLVGFRRSLLLSRSFRVSIGLMGLVAAPLILAGSLPYLQLSAQDSIPDRDLQLVSIGSASVSDFILPSTDHFLWGSWIGEHFSRDHWVEGTLYLGAIGLALSLLAILRVRSDHREIIRLLVILLIVGTALALGIHMYWNEARVRLDLPMGLASLLDRDSTSIPMPGYFLFQYLPFYAKMRTFKRMGVIALLAVCTLAGLGAAWLLRKVGHRRRNIVGIALVALALLDFYPGPIEKFVRVEPRAVDLWLAEQPGRGAVVEFPFYLQEEQAHVFYSLTHGKPILGGFFNAFPPPQYRRLKPIMAGFPDEASVQALRDLEVEYVILNSEPYSNSTEAISQMESTGLVRIASFDDTYVFAWPEG